MTDEENRKLLAGPVATQKQYTGTFTKPQSTQKAKPDIEVVVGNIDKFLGGRYGTDIEFLAGAVVPPGQIESKKIFDVYRVIKGIHGSAAPVIFKEVLSRCAKNDQYVKQLDQFCDDFEASQEDFLHKLEKWRRELTFREEFLNMIEEPGQLSFFLDEFTGDELGCLPDEIKSPAILFRQLFHRETILYGDSNRNQKIEDRLSKVQRMLKISTPEQGRGREIVIDERGPPAGNEVGSKLEDGIPTTSDGTPGNTSTSLPYKRYSMKFACCGVCAVVIPFILLLVFIGPSAHYGSLSSKSSRESFIIARNATVLVSGAPIKTLYQSTAIFELSSSSNPFPDSLVCQFDCSDNPPRKDVIPLQFSSDFDESNKNNGRRFARFAFGSSPLEISAYMLGTSNFSFTMALSADSPRELVFLHLFNDIVACEDYYQHNTISHQVGVFNLNDSNGYSTTYVVPPGALESYYCGIWEIQPNVTFNYTVVASIVVYDVGYYQSRGECMESPDKSFDIPLHTLGPFLPADICVLLSQVNDNTILNAVVLLIGSLRNGPFLIFVVFVGIFLLFLPISIIIIVICLCKRGTNSQGTVV